ncbi:MAG: primase C-terminal domain-containing protein, partial [Thermoanaerobaculia bacterium]
SKLGASVDVRGDGGLIFAPPADGRRFLIGSAPHEVPLPELPARWADAIRHLDAQRAQDGAGFVLPDVIGIGERNDRLFRYAASMRARCVEWTLLAGAVRRANLERCTMPLHEREVSTLLASVARYAEGRSVA